MPNLRRPSWEPASGSTLGLLVEASLAVRRARLHADGPRFPCREEHAARPAYWDRQVELMLSAKALGRSECSEYFARLVDRLSMASAVIDDVVTRIDPFVMDAVRSQALAVVLADVFRFAQSLAAPKGRLGMQVSMMTKARDLVTEIEVEGELALVGSAEAMRGYARAREIVELLGGRLNRAAYGNDAVLTIVMPRRGVQGQSV